MANYLDKIYVIDVESTCWNGPIPENQKSEIIEIGLTVVDLYTRSILHSKQYLITPAHSRVSEFCTYLTGWTEYRLVLDGKPFKEVIGQMQLDYPDLRKQIWASWGDYDRKMFVNNTRLHNIKYPFGGRHINIKSLFAIKNFMKQECSVNDALKRLNLKFEGHPHLALHDSYNIARILLQTI